jgi:hypothetical protein
VQHCWVVQHQLPRLLLVCVWVPRAFAAAAAAAVAATARQRAHTCLGSQSSSFRFLPVVAAMMLVVWLRGCAGGGGGGSRRMETGFGLGRGR